MDFLHSFKAEKATLPSKMTLSDFKPGQNGESPRKLNPLRPSNSVSKSAVSSTVANLLGPDADPNQFSATQLFSSMTLDRPQSEKVTGRSLWNNLYYRWASYKVGGLVAYKATPPPNLGEPMTAYKATKPEIVVKSDRNKRKVKNLRNITYISR